MASLRWSPDEDTQDAVAALVQSMRDGLPDLLTMAEFIQGCEVYDLDPYSVGLRVFPRFIQVHLRGEYITDVRYRDNLDLAVGDICIVVRFREGEQYEVFSAGGPTGGSAAFGWPEEATDPHGFENRLDSAISFVNGTRTFAIVGAAYNFWVYGDKYIGTGDSDILPAGTDWYFYFYDTNGNLDRTTSPILANNRATIAYVFWNNALGEGILFEERHGISMDFATHYHLHQTLGSRVISGFAIAGYTLSPAVPADADNTYSIANGFLADQDLEIWKAALADNGPYTVWHRDGAAGVWTWSTGLVLPFEYTVAGYIEYNQWTGATWQLTQLATNKYVNYFVFVTMSTNADHRYVIVPGQTVWDNLDDASNETIGSLALAEFPAIESGTLYRVTYRTLAGYGSTGKCRIELVTILIGESSVFITQAAPSGSHAALSDRDLPNQHPAESISLFTAFNEPGDDVDFRVEGTGEVNLILTDAGNNRVGMGGVPASDYRLCVYSTSTALTVPGTILASLNWTPLGAPGAVFPQALTLNSFYDTAFAPAGGFLISQFLNAQCRGAGAISIRAMDINVENRGAGTMGYARGLNIRSFVNNGGGAITTAVGLKIGAQTVAASNFAIQTDAGIVSFGDRVGIGLVAPAAKLHVDQESTTAAIPVLVLDQADVSEEMIEFISTIGPGNALEAKGGKSITTTHWIKVTLPGGLTRYLLCGTIA